MPVYTYVGVTPRSLASGRPVTFGTELQESDLEQADDSIKAHLVLSSPTEDPAPAATVEAPAPAEDPAPAFEVVTTGNPS